LLDLTTANNDICNIAKVVVTSTYMYFGIFVIFYDIIGFHRRDFLQIISIYLYLGIEDSLAKSSVPHYFITPQYVVWPSIENSYIPA